MLFTDQLHRTIELPFPPQRIVSLVPSQTELLFDLGLEEKIVGITRFCIHPQDKVKKVPKIGGTKKFHFEKIDELCPDLIIANKEENYREGIEQLAQKYPVWVSDVITFEDALQMILKVGEICGKKWEAQIMVSFITASFSMVQKMYSGKVAYLIWKNPYMAVGNHTFIHDILQKLGFTNVFAEKSRYPEVTISEIAELQPDYVFLSSEPYPFKEKHLQELQNALPFCQVKLVNGEMFSWYGSRLIHASKYFQKF
ncbi:MAG: helical backbone metal receptor [Raineya sp.]|nr:helical backbone metal receptor [Raineya sp.]MDW8296792.1 helical backbone metal receptor [Raineya sp.]